ncbi:MAG TPA: GAF domain-containing protein [Anaerolineales bacterium]|jgi:signal transduction histidine kinase
MTADSKIHSQLKDALYLTQAAWAVLADREGGQWQVLSAQQLTRPRQKALEKILSQPTVDAWLCGALSGGNSRSASLPDPNLGGARLFAFPVAASARVILVGAPQQTARHQRIWRMLASLASNGAAVSATNPSLLPELLAGLPYDLPRSLDRILSAVMRVVSSESAWLAIRRGDALDIEAERNAPRVKGTSVAMEANPLLRRVNRTLAEVVAEAGTPDWKLIPSAGARRGARFWICMPLVLGKRVIGVIALSRNKKLTPAEWQSLRELAAYVAPSVEVVVTFSEMAAHMRRLAMFNEFALTVSSAQTLDQIVKRVFGFLSRGFDTELLGLYLLSNDGMMIREYLYQERKLVSRNLSLSGHPVMPYLQKERVLHVDDLAGTLLPVLNSESRSALAAPLRYRGKPIGLLVLESTRAQAFNLYDDHLMFVLGSHLAGLVEYSRLREEAEGRARNLGLIHEVVQHVIGQTNKQEMAQTTADLLAQYFAFELAAVLLHDPQRNLIAQGFGGTQAANIKDMAKGLELPIQTGITGYVFNTGNSILVNDTSQDGMYKPLRGWRAASEMCAALRDGDRVLGIINVESSQPNAFTQNDLLAIESLAGILATVVTSADQYQRLQKTIQQLRLTQVELKTRMDAQRAAENRLVQAAKLAAVGEMAAGIAHELNNPLTTVSGFTELVLEEIPADVEYRAELEMVLREARRASDVVRRLLDFSRQGERTRARASLNEIVDDVIALTGHLIHTNGVHLSLELSEQLRWVSVDRNQMKQVLLNLIHNALQAMPSGGQLLISTAERDKDGRTWAALCIRDSGTGMSPADRDRVFEPFFTTRGEIGGTGLGLSVTYGIVTDHGGVIDVESAVGTGTAFTVWLPL